MFHPPSLPPNPNHPLCPALHSHRRKFDRRPPMISAVLTTFRLGHPYGPAPDLSLLLGVGVSAPAFLSQNGPRVDETLLPKLTPISNMCCDDADVLYSPSKGISKGQSPLNKCVCAELKAHRISIMRRSHLPKDVVQISFLTKCVILRERQTEAALFYMVSVQAKCDLFFYVIEVSKFSWVCARSFPSSNFEILFCVPLAVRLPLGFAPIPSAVHRERVPRRTAQAATGRPLRSPRQTPLRRGVRRWALPPHPMHWRILFSSLIFVPTFSLFRRYQKNSF